MPNNGGFNNLLCIYYLRFRGVMLNYERFVKLNKIECIEAENGLYRYGLIIPFADVPKNPVLVILKNPSTASHFKSDMTINRVTHYCYKAGFDKVTVVNIFAFRAKDINSLVEMMNSKGPQYVVGDENDIWIEREVKNSKHIIIAWGTPTKKLNNKEPNEIYIMRILKVMHLLSTLSKPISYVGNISDSGLYPLHGMIWGYDMPLCNYQ